MGRDVIAATVDTSVLRRFLPVLAVITPLGGSRGTGREQGCRGGADREVVGERSGYADAERDSGGTSLARRRLSASVPTPRLASRRTFSLGERAL